MLFVKKWLFRIVGVLIFVVVMLLASENSDSVHLGFLGFQTGEWPIAWWMLAAFVVGLFAGMLMNAWTNAGLKRDVRKAKKEAAKGHRELDKVHARTTAATPVVAPAAAIEVMEESVAGTVSSDSTPESET